MASYYQPHRHWLGQPAPRTLPNYKRLRRNDAMMEHAELYPARPHGLSTHAPETTWPQTLLDFYRAAYSASRAAQLMWALAQLCGWRDKDLNEAYQQAQEALERIDTKGEAWLRAWEQEEHWR